jgi:hypothetical protein
MDIHQTSFVTDVLEAFVSHTFRHPVHNESASGLERNYAHSMCIETPYSASQCFSYPPSEGPLSTDHANPCLAVVHLGRVNQCDEFL